MRILILTTSDFPYYGADESFVRNLALGLNDNAKDVKVVRFWGVRNESINDTKICTSNYLFSSPFRNEFIKVIETLLQIMYIPIFVFKIKSTTDLILLYGLDKSYYVYPLTTLCKILNIKVFRVITEIYEQRTYANKWWRKPLTMFVRMQFKMFDKKLSGVIVLSTYLEKYMQSCGLSSRNILVIPNMVEINVNRILSEKVSLNKTIYGFCGTPTYANGVYDLLDGFDLLVEKYNPNSELRIIGKIDDQLIAKKESLKSKDLIILYGHLSWKDAVEEIQNCDVMVNPRRTGIHAVSGFPTKIGEYFSALKPVVTTRLGDLAKFLYDGEHVVFVEANNPDSIANGMLKLSNNKDLSEKLAIMGYNWAVENLEYKNNSKKIYDFMSNINT